MISKSLLAGFAGVITTAALSLPAQAREWVQLGEQTVNRHTDRDILYVGSDEGRYEALRFRALGNDVAFAEVRVIYGNGSSEVLNVKEHVHAGEATRPYDLQGRHRVINRIEFLYQTEGHWGGKATVQVAGLKDTGGSGGGFGDWTSLGTREVSLVADHDVIPVGGVAGKFRAIKFHVTGRPIKLYDVRVTFGNGQQQQFNFAHLVSAGAYSPTLDLRGDERVISRIDLVYKKEYAGGHAFVTVYGLH